MKKLIETQKDFKACKLLYSFVAEDAEEAAQKISKNVFYNSEKSLTMYSLNKKTMFFYVVNSKGEVNQDLIVMNQEKNNRYQLRQRP